MASSQVESPIAALQEKPSSDDNDALQDRQQETTPRNVDVLPGEGTLKEEEKIAADPPAAAAAATSDELIAQELDAKVEITAPNKEALALPASEEEEEVAVPTKGITKEEEAEAEAEAAAAEEEVVAPDVVMPVDREITTEPAVSDEPPPLSATEEDAEEVPSEEKEDD